MSSLWRQASHLKAELEQLEKAKEEETREPAVARAAEGELSALASTSRGQEGWADKQAEPQVGVLGGAILHVCRSIEALPEAAIGGGEVEVDWLWVQLVVQQSTDELGN